MKLELPETSKIHPIFHVSKLKKFKDEKLKIQTMNIAGYLFWQWTTNQWLCQISLYISECCWKGKGNNGGIGSVERSKSRGNVLGENGDTHSKLSFDQTWGRVIFERGRWCNWRYFLIGPNTRDEEGVTCKRRERSWARRLQRELRERRWRRRSNLDHVGTKLIRSSVDKSKRRILNTWKRRVLLLKQDLIYNWVRDYVNHLPGWMTIFWINSS